MAPRSLPPCAPCTAPVVGTTSGSPSLNVAVHPSCHALLPRPRPRPSLQTPVPPDLTSLGRTLACWSARLFPARLLAPLSTDRPLVAALVQVVSLPPRALRQVQQA